MKKILSFFLASLLILSFTACGSGENEREDKTDKKSPTEKQMIEDLSQEETVIATIDNTGRFEIKNIDIELADTEEDIYEADVVIKLENKVYSIQRKVAVKYKQYDVGGWILEEISGGNTIKSKVIGPYPESAAINSAKNKYDNVKLESHETDLANMKDVFTFSSTHKGKFFDYTINFVETYSGANGTWQKTDSRIKNSDSKLNLIDGLYYFGGSEDGHVIHFNDDSTVTMLFEETKNVRDVNTSEIIQTSKMTEKPTLYFDENSLSYSMEFGSYDFTITQNDIIYYNSTLDNICFFEKKWLREKFYNECVVFLNQDKNRNIDEYASDLSSAITEKDVYGVWNTRYDGSIDYYFKVSATGVDSGPTKEELTDVTLPRSDLLFYGYDAQKQAYIVYYCTRTYTTSSFYVSQVHTLEFVKTENGTVQLRRHHVDW